MLEMEALQGEMACFYAKKDRNNQHTANQEISTARLRHKPCCFYPSGAPTHLPPFPPYLIMQSLSPKHIARSDIVKLKFSQHCNEVIAQERYTPPSQHPTRARHFNYMYIAPGQLSVHNDGCITSFFVTSFSS